MCASTRSGSCPRTRAGCVTAFLESFFARYVEYDFTADLEEQLDRVSNSEIDWRELLRDFWRDFTAAVGEIKDLRVAQVIDALNEMLGAASVSAARRRHRSAPVPDLRHRPAVAEARQVRRLHRLLELSGMPLHPPARRPAARRRRPTAAPQARRRSGDRPRGDAAQRPLRPLCAARRGGRGREAQARQPAQGARARRRRSRRARSRCCRCRARSASIPRTASRSWPASAASAPMCSTARPTPISTPATTCSTSG